MYPGIAVAQALKAIRPEVKPLFLCTERPIDQTILEPTGFELIAQPIVPPVKTIGGQGTTVTVTFPHIPVRAAKAG